MQFNMPIPAVVTLSPSHGVPSASARAPRGVRHRIILRLGQMLKDHLSFSLEKVFTFPENIPVIADEPDLVPDIWVTTLSRDPVRTRTIVEPGLIIEVQSSTNKMAPFAGRIRRYRAVDSVREILVIDSAGRSFEIYRRTSPMSWIVEDRDATSRIYLQTVDFEFAGDRLWSLRKATSTVTYPTGERAVEC